MQRRTVSASIVCALAAYFGVLLLPNWWPHVGASVFYFFYFLSVPLVLLALLAGVAIGTISLSRGPREGDRRASKSILVVSANGFALFAVTILAASILPQSLPTGSFVRPFDSAAWQQEDAAEFSDDGDITPRQKMLGDLITRVLPRKNREEVVALLGPSTETSFSRESGRHLVYATGPQRDSFFALDSEWLLIWFDEAGRFERYEVAAD
jgi:hypothetical protein